MPNKLPLSLGILSFRSHPTLINTLNSYQSSGLLDLVSDRFIFFQEISGTDRSIAEKYGFECFGESKNIGIANGYKALLNKAKEPNFLFLENDWEIKKNNFYLVEKQISEAVDQVHNHLTDVARLRSRYDYGDPLWTLQFKDKELTRPEHLLDCVHWVENPALSFPNQISNNYPSWYKTTAKFANWTNNPHIIRTDWAKEILLPHLGNADIEKNLQKWWQQTNNTVSQGEGLFTHHRL